MSIPTLYDNHGRPLNYLRLAVTDRCNLRCFYCMPEEGIRYLPKKELLSFEEIERLVTLLAGMGIRKIRLTGGEPFLRKDLMELIRRIAAIPGMEFHLTTNGVLTEPHIPELKALGIRSVNLSLDSIDRERFKQITRRDEFIKVWQTFERLLEADIPVKINAVVMENKNIEDILPMVALTRDYPISVRFIEEMPFNGEGNHYPQLRWNYKQILTHIREGYPEIQKITDPANATAAHYEIPGFAGNFGIIAAFSRTFCGTCNRIRVTAQGEVKTCLYDSGVLDLKKLLRQSKDDNLVRAELMHVFADRAKDGFEAEQRRQNHAPVSESMSTIGG